MEGGSSSGAENYGRRNAVVWTPLMDEALLDALMRQQEKGFKQNGSFISQAYDNIVIELKEKIGDDITKDKVKNRWKTLKSNFAKCYDFWRNGMSGFAWNPTTKLWSAEPEVWESLIKDKPAAREWMTKPIPHYDKMLILYGNDRATGDESGTAKEVRRRQAFEQVETIDEIDHLVSENEVNLESCDPSDDAEQHFSEVQTRKTKKAKGAKNDNDDGMLIKEAIDNVAQVMERGNLVLEKVMQRLPIPEEQLWTLLEEISLEPHVLTDAYVHLIAHPEKIRALLGCPQHRRKDIVMRLVFGHFGP